MTPDILVEELSAILVRNNVLSFQDAQALRQEFIYRDDISFEDFLLEQGVVEKEDLLQALSDYYGVPAVDVIGEFFDHQFLRLIPKDVMIRHAMIPFWRDGDTLGVVAAQPDDPHLLVVLGDYVTHDITFMVGLAQDIIESIEEFYDESITYQPNDIENRQMERSAWDEYSPTEIESHNMERSSRIEYPNEIDTELNQRIPLLVETTDDDYESKG